MKKMKKMLAEVKVDEVIVWNNDGTISYSSCLLFFGCKSTVKMGNSKV